MKKLLLILLCWLILFGCCIQRKKQLAQQTYVPDDNFEAYLENKGMGNGIANDDSVFTSAIDTVIYLRLSTYYERPYNTSITDLTGIEDFTALKTLICGFNQIKTLDVSQNTALTKLLCLRNKLTNLNLGNNTALTELVCSGNNLTTLDVSQNTALIRLNCHNNQLTTLDVSNNTALDYLSCGNNKLTNLDVSNNRALTALWCSNNQLTSLDIRNIHPPNLRNNFSCAGNPQLYCINVHNANYATVNWTVIGLIDPQNYFSENCP